MNNLDKKKKMNQKTHNEKRILKGVEEYFHRKEILKKFLYSTRSDTPLFNRNGYIDPLEIRECCVKSSVKINSNRKAYDRLEFSKHLCSLQHISKIFNLYQNDLKDMVLA